MDSTIPDRDRADVTLLTRPADDVEKMLEDAVPPPSCEWQEGGAPEPCGKPATYICLLACGHSFYYCDGHKAEREAYLRLPGMNYCRGRLDKGKMHDGPKLADPVRFERIER